MSPQRRGSADVRTLREQNSHAVLLALAEHGPLSRAQIAEHTGLGVTALTKIVNALREVHAVVDAPAHSAGAGRPTIPLALDETRHALLGIEFLPHAVTVHAGDLRARARDTFTAPCPPGSSGFARHERALRSAVAAAIRWCTEHRRTVFAAEASVPGAVDRTAGVVRRSVVGGWQSVELEQVVRSVLREHGAEPQHVGVDRETNYALIRHCARHDGDRPLGARGSREHTPQGDNPQGPRPREHPSRDTPPLDGHPRVAFIGGTMGLSGAIMLPAGVERGAGGLAGEFGHVRVPSGRGACWCGRHDCAETVLGPRALTQQLTGADPGFHPEAHARAFAAVPTDPARLDPGTRAVLGAAATSLAELVDTVTGVINPSTVLVGGRLAQLGPVLEPALRAALNELGLLPAQRGLHLAFCAYDPAETRTGLLVAAQRYALRALAG